MNGVKIIFSIVSSIIGLALAIGMLNYFGIDVVGAVTSGLADLKEIIQEVIHMV